MFWNAKLRWLTIDTAAALAAAALCAALLTEPVYAAPQAITKESSIGCKNKEVKRKLVSMAIDKDIEAFKKLALATILTGECRFFSAGDQVHLEDTAIFTGLICLRPRGEVSCYWTESEATE